MLDSALQARRLLGSRFYVTYRTTRGIRRRFRVLFAALVNVAHAVGILFACRGCTECN